MRKRIGTWFGYGWATPVVSRCWAFAASVLESLKPGPASHRAWERACGIERATS